MSLYTTENREEIKQTLIHFREQYEEALGYDVGYLNAHLEHDQLGNPLTSAFLSQIYEAAGLIKPNCSVYRRMARIVNQNFNLKRDVVEIGSGIFPILGDDLRKRQLQLGEGTVTVYDAKVWTKYPTSAKLVRSYFRTSTEISPNSLLVGLFPCDATNTIVEKALNEDLEFCIALCACNHSDNPYLSTSEYHELLINQIQGQLSSKKKLKLEYFPSICFGNKHHGFPILVAKSKTKEKILSFLNKSKR